MVRLHVISAIFSRNLAQYFSGVLGYLFIVVFVTLCALAAFNQQFFADNLATLDQLTKWYPWLLLFLTPAISMTVWADERRQGTDALLFTLPASDLEILLGKYFSVGMVYTIALLFSLTQLIALRSLGQPDWGIIFTTYLGYWLAGLSLLAIGMFASSLTESPTVAFVLGATFSAVPVVVGYYFRGNAMIESFGFESNLHDFTIGLISAANVFYFLTLIIVFLYLNLIVISRRQWRSKNTLSMWTRYILRLAAVVVALGSVHFIVTSISTGQIARIDMTRERAFSLDPTTLSTVEQMKKDERTVSIQAFVSDEVPRDFVNAKKQFLGMLQQLSYFAGNRIEVNLVTVKPNSLEAEQADKTGIIAQDTTSDIGGKMIQQKVYLGAYLSSSIDNVTIPQINGQSSIEYELTRALAATTQKDWQLKIGILDTDTHFGGFEFRGQRVPWVPYEGTLKQLQNLFDIVYINQSDLVSYVDPPKPPETPDPSSPPIPEPPKKKDAPDVLIVADPASLDAMATDALVKYLKDGNPTLVMVDPLPFFWTTREPKELGIINAPQQPRVSPQSPYFVQLGSSELPKADNGTAIKIMSALGIQWDNGTVAWNAVNPHPNFPGYWPPYLGPSWPEYFGKFDYAFVYAVRSDDPTVRPKIVDASRVPPGDTANPGVGSFATFNPDDLVSSQLKEVLFFYPGEIKPDSAVTDLNFIPLIRLGKQSGVIPWKELTFKPTRREQTMNPTTRRVQFVNTPIRSPITDDDLIVVKPTPLANVDAQDHVLAARVVGSGENKTNAIVIADLDFVTGLYTEQQEHLGSPSLDNFRLLQNAIEVLAGKSGFISLRNRRSVPRSLTAFEKRISVYRKQRYEAEEANKKEIDERLTNAQKRLDESIKSIDEDKTTSMLEKLQLSSQEAVDAQEKFTREQIKLEKELQLKNQNLKAQESRKISDLESWIRGISVALAPLPALLLGIFVFVSRSLKETSSIRPERKVKS